MNRYKTHIFDYTGSPAAGRVLRASRRVWSDVVRAAIGRGRTTGVGTGGGRAGVGVTPGGAGGVAGGRRDGHGRLPAGPPPLSSPSPSLLLPPGVSSRYPVRSARPSRLVDAPNARNGSPSARNYQTTYREVYLRQRK